MEPLSYLENTCPGALDTVPAQLFLTLLQTLVNTQCGLKSTPLKNYANNLKDGEVFDFIVVGAGSAGSVVANRLSENPNWNVLLLEAGYEPSTTSEVPALLFSMQETEESWKYEPEEQEFNCRGFKDKKCKWYTGRALGGSSSINGLLYTRGYPWDYNNWEAMGNEGWNFEEVLKYFKKSEDNIDFGDNKKYHSTGGLLKVSAYSYDPPLKKVLIKSATEMGIPYVKDMHNGTTIYFSNTQGTVYKGERWSTYKGFLKTALDRKNLKIATGAYVTKVVIDKDSKKASGVLVKIGENLLNVKVKKEVVLSAGALRSPQILMLSGIGPEKHLQQFNIPVIKNLPVGENLQDHIMFLGYYLKLTDELVKQQHPMDTIYEYFMHRKGILSSVNIINFIGVINTLNDSQLPDIQFHHAAFQKNDPYALPLILKVMGLNEVTVKSILEQNKISPLAVVWPKLLRPESKGHLRLKSTNAFDKPIMTSNYLKEEDDVERILRAMKFSLNLLKTKSFSKYKPEVFQIDLPNCKHETFQSDDYWRCAIRSLSTTVYHYCGTTKMGPESDPESVVNPRLKVRGIENLRVIDASIIPKIVSANTNAPCIMIGEKGADLIKEDWKYKQKEEL